MTDHSQPRRSRTVVAALLGLLLVAVVAVVVVALVTAGSAAPAAPASSRPAPSSVPTPVVTPSESATTGPTPTATATASAAAKPTAAPRTTPTRRAAPAPQPTKTAAIKAPTTIVKALTAKVAKLEAVSGQADGPGEIAGPSVRFTVTITNTTGKRVDLAATVVNAYYGSDATPAVQLQKPGGAPFPGSVADGATATGVFVFNIPSDERAKVRVTVDTSVDNPVVAFEGSAPR